MKITLGETRRKGLRAGFIAGVLAGALLWGGCRGTPAPAGDEPETMPETGENGEEAPPEGGEAGEEEPPEILLEADIPEDLKELPVSGFNEIWGYLMAGREGKLAREAPITDLVYFGATLGRYSTLINVPDRRNLGRFQGRVHMSVTCDSQSQTHLILQNGPLRDAFIRELLEAVKPFDGLNIDMENAGERDAGAFAAFLLDIRKGLGGRMLTCALPARTRALSKDQYDYARLAPLVDRVFVMAYDEHWSGSRPGPVASMNWCKTVAAHALKVIGPENMIMGLPFYGRAWGSEPTSRALVAEGVEDLRKAFSLEEVTRENGVPYFKYEIPVTVTVYYDDAYSLSVRAAMYREMGVRKIGFWAMSQESKAVWRFFTIEQ